LGSSSAFDEMVAARPGGGYASSVLEWLRREATRRWLIPVGLVCVLVAAFVLGSDNPIYVLLLGPIAATLYSDIGKLMSPRPRLSLAAEYTGSSTTTSGPDGARIVSYARVVLFLRNGEDAGEARHCKVELVTTAAPWFTLDGHATEATANLRDGDTWRVVWQPGTLGPGAERELPLISQSFAFDGGTASAHVRVSADRMDPLEKGLVLRVGRYEDDTGDAEFEVTV
jgi:hypothetical protein